MQVEAVGSAAQYPTATKLEPIAFRPLHIAATVTQSQIKPPVVSSDDAVGAVQSVRIFFRRQAAFLDQIASLLSDSIAFRIAQ